jgi:glycosyltransferase involved in cell wall biosynthesis
VRITVLCPHLGIAGGVRAILAYADRLAGRGHAVEVIVPARSRFRALRRRFAAAGPGWLPGFRPRVRWVVRWDPARLPEADVLVATAWQSAPVVAAAARRCGAKFYLIQHYESLYHGDPATVDATYRLPLRQIVISSWLRDVMRERFASQADVLVTPIDRALFHRVPTDAATRRPRVLMLHHHYAWKGVGDGLEAVARVRASVPSLWLVGFGVTAPRTPLPYDEFHVNPAQDRLAGLYSTCDIYLCPSWDEGLGMPPMEAMACGVALVTYDNGGCRDYAIDGETALVARRRDVADLAAKLVRLAADDGLRGRIAAAGQTFIITRFDWETAVGRMEALFREGDGFRSG